MTLQHTLFSRSILIKILYQPYTQNMAISITKPVIIFTALQSVMLVWVWNVNKLKAKNMLKYLPGSEPTKPAEMGDSLKADLWTISMEMATEHF